MLDRLSLEIAAGEVHALVGHNGSGKSTCVRLLAGYYEPDPGAEASVDGTPIAIGSAAAAEATGLRFVHQDLGLVDTLDAVDNVLLGSAYPTGVAGRIDWPAARARTAETLASLGVEIPSDAPVGGLSPTQRTAVAIARALHPRSVPTRVLVLDEPTAALPAREVATLFGIVRVLQARGLAILYISHHLEEVLELSLRVTVLRDGATVTTTTTASLDEPRLVELMIGESQQRATHTRRVAAAAEPGRLRVSRLSARRLQQLSFDLADGEIVGIAGLDGSGREELAASLFGGVAREGEVRVGDRVLPSLRPDVAVALGIGLVPADRDREAALHRMSVTENLSAGRIPTRLAGLLLDAGAERHESRTWIERLRIVPPRPDAVIDALSGGNQQKVMIARWLRIAPRVLILDEPTKGVDVAAVADIWDAITDAAHTGAAVLVCSSDAHELAAYCDRVLVLRAGRIARELAGNELDADLIDSLTLTDHPVECR